MVATSEDNIPTETEYTAGGEWPKPGRNRHGSTGFQ